MEKQRVILAGATGWAGSALAGGIATALDLELVSAVGRKSAGRALGDVLGDPALVGCPIFATVAEALAALPVRAERAAEAPEEKDDVFVEYTLPDSARANVLAALDAGVHVVIGTSGLGDDDLAQIDAAAIERKRAVLACGNFALTAVLLQQFAAAAARWIPSFEVIDYGKLMKPDAPSGTARELAARLGAVRKPDIGVPLAEAVGPPEARGASVGGVQVHSVRVPGFVSSVEVVFGKDGERLHLRHESTGSAAPYVTGALLAIRQVHGLSPGLHRGLDSVMTD